MSNKIGVLTIADATGDRKYSWKRIKDAVKKPKSKSSVSTTAKSLAKKEPEDVQRMRALFDQAMKEGKDAYAMDGPGDLRSGRKITKFDPSARFITIMPHLSPGKY